MPDVNPYLSVLTTPSDTPVEVKPPPSTDPTIMLQQPTEAEPPLEVWAQVNGMPYTAKHFDVNVWNESAERDVQAIEGYILNEIGKKGLEPTIASYNEIMANITSFLQLSPNTASNVQFERVVDYVKLFSKYHKIEKQKKQILEQASKLREIEYG